MIPYWIERRIESAWNWVREKVRGTEYPYSAGWDEWEDIEEAASTAHPLRFWLAETFMRKLKNFLLWPTNTISHIRYKLRCRFRYQLGWLRCDGLSNWDWHDCDERLLHGMFGMLVDFIETELAAWERKHWWQPRRSRELGLKHLAWESELKWGDGECIPPDDPDYGQYTHQAKAAREKRALYLWWKDERPNRMDPYDLVDSDNPRRDPRSYDEIYGAMNAEQQRQKDEDVAMMHRLIAVRESMWT